jgi:DNA-binding MarR family transcriptional regulator
MASLETALKQKKFTDEKVKANINVLYTANWLYNRISAMLKPFAITHEQFNVLRILRGSHPTPMCQKDILARMIAPQSNLTLILKKLTAKQLVSISRSERDNREYVIEITKAGLELLQQIDNQFKTKGERFNQLTKAEAMQLNELLDKLREE